MIANSNSIAHHVIQIKNEIIKHVNMNVKMIVVQKIIVGILVHVFVKMVKYLKSIANTLVSVCDEIINGTDIACDKYEK